MADQVEIILRGSSKELEASINRIVAGLRRMSAQSTATQTTMQTGARRTSASIQKQNQSFTLMVAKLALVSFAVQTLANIFSSTFGAMLRNIDDFNVAAIGTAAAVTGISDVGGQSLGDSFNQNLDAALATFEALEIVAAEFFSTGQELQLAFNTLAQRGVVIREDEFRILGKVTDQIKLLTGGQNSQIQIQQELRAILDGNVRTTTAFGKALQARGVDIQQLSREVRATGSLKPFEPFLTGLDSAGPAIRRTLSSVTATFSSLFNILQRNIFQDTFDGVVSDITDINNFLIDQRDLIIQIGKFILDNISGAWDRVINIVDDISVVIIKIARNDLAQFAGAIFIITKLLQRGPLGILLSVAAALTGVTGEASTFTNVLNIVSTSLALGFEGLLRIIDAVIRKVGQLVEQFLALKAGGITGGGFLRQQIAGIQQTENNIVSLKQELTELDRDQNRLFELGDRRNAAGDQALLEGIKQRVDLTKQLSEQIDILRKKEENTARSSQEGKEFIENRDDILGVKSFSAGLAEGIEKLSKDMDRFANEKVGGTKEQLVDLAKEFAELAKLNVPVTPRRRGEFTNTSAITEDTVGREIAREKAANAVDDRLFKSASERRKRALTEGLANIGVLAAKGELSGREAFDKANQLRREANDLELTQLGEQLEQQKRRTALEVERIEALRTTSNADDKITDEAAILQTLRAQEQGAQKIAGIQEKIFDLRTKGATAELSITREITEETRKTNILLDKRDREIAAFGGQTNAERGTQIDAESALRQQAFNRDNTDPAQQDRFAAQETLKRTQQAIETQVNAIANAIDAAFSTLVDGLVEGSFEFRDAAKGISKDLIKSGLEGLINETKSVVSEGLQKMFDGFSTVAAQRAAQALALGLGLLLAVLSRIGNEGDFTATGGGGGTGIDSSGINTRGLVGGDTSIPIAEINNGLLEALIPTNNILSAIERNTRVSAEIGSLLGGGGLTDLINTQVDQLFQQQLLTNP